MVSTRSGIARAGLFALLVLASPGLPPASAAAADDPATQVLGNWLTETRDGIIEISRAGDGTYQGKIVGGNAPQRLDQNNPDESKRSQLLLGHTILQGLKYDGDGKWSGGTIYDPDSGRLYKCRLELLDAERLQVRGFIGFALLGRSQIWTRYRSSEMTLPAAPQR
jgi:uncharacterized protein (DUF2147 family)